MKIETEEQAAEALAALAAFYRQPVMPLKRFCAAISTWARCTERANGMHAHEVPEGAELRPNTPASRSYAQYLGAILRDIRKSNLLHRLLYRGELLRTRPCPSHKGRQGAFDPVPCPHGCDFTGWLREDFATPKPGDPG